MTRMLSLNWRVGLCAEMAYQNGPEWETTGTQENCRLRGSAEPEKRREMRITLELHDSDAQNSIFSDGEQIAPT